MTVCKTLVRTSVSSLQQSLINRRNRLGVSHTASNLCLNIISVSDSRMLASSCSSTTMSYGSSVSAISPETTDFFDKTGKDTVGELLRNRNGVARFMKMERKAENDNPSRWFPYIDMFKSGNLCLTSNEIMEALDGMIMDERKERIRNVVQNRSYSVCLVVEGLSDFGNVSAIFRSADALGFQSVHVVSCDNSKRYKDNRHVSMGAEKWLDIEVWNSTKDALVSIYDMDWSFPTAIVVGNENTGISEEALELSDLHGSVPMKGMVDSFNVSVASGILMHHAVCDRTNRLGVHGDLTPSESQILLAEFSLRHSQTAISVAHEYAKRKQALLSPKL
ncbi:hypothetical protein MKW92_048360 [Papaver armeniacum]|nr:hypothetical protein MKW92_048360 [Papaver armeniacum]